MISRGPYAIDATPERRPEENQAARNRPAFDCVACGERVARRDTIALHRQLPYHHALALAPPPPPAQVNGQQSACDMCAPCAARWLEIQARDGLCGNQNFTARSC